MKKLLSIITVYVVAIAATLLISIPAFAIDNPTCDKGFLGFTPWYAGLTEGSPECKLEQPCAGSKCAKETMATFVWTIVMNVISDLFVASGYICVGFIIYGGFTYIISQGSPTGIEKGKKTITNAIIGLVIAILATAIVNTIKAVIFPTDPPPPTSGDDTAIILNIINGVVLP